jgi:hypothetical protein
MLTQYFPSSEQEPSTMFPESALLRSRALCEARRRGGRLEDGPFKSSIYPHYPFYHRIRRLRRFEGMY